MKSRRPRRRGEVRTVAHVQDVAVYILGNAVEQNVLAGFCFG